MIAASGRGRADGSFAAVALATGLCLLQAVWAEEVSGIHDDCAEVISGSFTAVDTPTTVFIGACPENRYLQFEDGPRRSLAYTDYLRESYTCTDRDIQLDHVVLRTACLGSSCVPNYSVYRVNATERALEHVYSMAFMDYEWLHRPLVTATGECLWRGTQKAEAALDAALAPVLVGCQGDANPWEELKQGDTLALSPRRLRTETVINALGTINLYARDAMLRLNVGVMSADYLSEVARDGLPDDALLVPGPKDRATFRVLQVQRHSYCGGGGTLLVEDTRHRTWAAIHDFGAAACDGYRDDEGMGYLLVRDAMLYAQGYGSWFEIDLRKHSARRLLEEPEFVAEALADMYEEPFG